MPLPNHLESFLEETYRNPNIPGNRNQRFFGYSRVMSEEEWELLTLEVENSIYRISREYESSTKSL